MVRELCNAVDENCFTVLHLTKICNSVEYVFVHDVP